MRVTRRVVLLVLSIVAGLPLMSQNVIGTYRGPYTFSWPVAQCTFTVSGTMDASVTQSGRSVHGSILISNYQFFKAENGQCVGVDRPFPSAILLEDAEINNGAFDGDLILFGLHPPFKGTLNSTTFSGATSGTANGQFTGRISFQLTRISAQALPLISVSYTRDRPSATGNAWLYWASAGATGVYIGANQTLGLFGHFQMAMPATRTFTLTATAAGGRSSTTATTILTARLPEPDVVLAAPPAGMLQRVGASAASTTLTLTNFGGTNADVTLTPDGTFFSATPQTFTLTPLASQVVTLTATTQQAGVYEGSLAIAGSGVTAGWTLPVSLLVAASASGPGPVTTSAPRRDFAAPAGANPPASLTFTNSGGSTIEGLLSAGVPWIGFPDAHVTLGPGETRIVDISIDRSRRTGPAIGGASGEVVFRHLATDGASAGLSVTVLDVITPAPVFPSSLTTLLPGRIWFAPGAARTPSSFSDFSLVNLLPVLLDANPTYYPYGQQNGARFDLNGDLRVPASASMSFPRMLQHVFPQHPDEGTVISVGVSTLDLPLRHTRVNTSGGVTTHTPLPVFHSEQGYAPGADLFLTGLQKTRFRTTTLYLQEVTAIGAAVTLDFFNSGGRAVGPGRGYALSKGQSIKLEDAVPSGATSVRIRNNTAGTRINAFGLVFDTTSPDLLPIEASLPGTGTLFCPAFPAAPGTREMYLYLANTADAEITVSATLSELAPEGTAKRRSVGHSVETHAIETHAGPFTIPALGSSRLRVTGDGVVRLTGPAALRATAAMTVPGIASAGRVGSAVPFLPASAAMVPAGGAKRRFSGVEDASPATIAAKRAGTYRTNLMLVETLGKQTLVKVTLHYQFPGGNPNDGADMTVEYILPANGVITIVDVARTLLGPLAAGYGDIHDAAIELEISGSGAANGGLLTFLQTVDNATGDIAIRLSD
jgi:hypothetical protein